MKRGENMLTSILKLCAIILAICTTIFLMHIKRFTDYFFESYIIAHSTLTDSEKTQRLINVLEDYYND